jgi:uncharacterized coiled-coil protein SlyX
MEDRLHTLELKVAVISGTNEYLVEKAKVLEREIERLQRS